MKLVPAHLLALACACSIALASVPARAQAGGDLLVLAEAQRRYRAGRDLYYDGAYAAALDTLLAVERLYRGVGVDTGRAFAKTRYAVGDAYRRLRRHPEAVATYTEVLRRFRENPGYDSLDVAEVYVDLGRTYSQMYLPERAMASYGRVAEIYRDSFGERSREMANLRMNVGIDLVKAASYREAERELLAARDVFREVSDSTSVDFNRIYSNLGVLYRKRGDYPRAVAYAQRALRVKLLNYDSLHPSVGKYYRNIGVALLDDDRPREALPYYRQAHRHSLAAFPPDHPQVGGSYGELSNVYAELGELDRAWELQRVANRIVARAYPPTHPYAVAGVYNEGRLLEDLGRDAEALARYREALRRFAASSEPPAEKVAMTHEQMARVQLRRGRVDSALHHVDLGLRTLSPGLAPGAHPAPSQVQAELRAVDLLGLRARARLDRAAPTRGDSLRGLADGLAAAEAGAELVRAVRAGYGGEGARQSLRDRSQDLFDGGIEAAHRLYRLSGDADYLRRGLELANAAKAGLLRDRLREEQIRGLAELPPEVGARLDAAAQRLREQRAEDFGSASSRAAFFAYEALRDSVASAFPRYALLGRGRRLKVEALRDRLPASSALVDYWLTDSAIYATVLTDGGLRGFATPLGADFRADLVRVARPAADELLSDPAAWSAYAAASRRLYGALLAPLADHLRGEGIGRLLLVPSGDLHLLGWAGLRISAEEAAPRYLVHDFAVATLAAADELLAERTPRTSDGAGTALVALAPDFAGPAGAGVASRGLGDAELLPPLPRAAAEAQDAVRLLGGWAALGPAATEAAFRTRAPGARVVHLATHGRLDGADPLASGLYLAPGPDDDGYLSALELAGLRLPAELAVLSACRSGGGAVQTGEGVLSLARAFALAGCRATVSNRWAADDAANARVVEAFYARLRDGDATDEALRAAQLAYLAGADPAAAHPYFWAGLALTGRPAELRMRGGLRWWWLAGLAAVALVGWGLRRRRRESSV